ncbi:MAG: type II secretion system protein GspD [Gammaproteobacteria bacterium]|nr:type II secretion system protein GspD [Gammaproteobacteria bacterium]
MKAFIFTSNNEKSKRSRANSLVVGLCCMSIGGCGTTALRDHKADDSFRSDKVWVDASLSEPVVDERPVQETNVSGSAAAANESTGMESAPEGAAPEQAVAKTAEDNFISLGSGSFIDRSEDEAGSKEKDNITLNYKGTDLREVVKTIIGDILQDNYYIDPSVKGEVTLRTSKPIKKSSLIPTLETILKMNGSMLVKSNGIYKVLPENADILGAAEPGVVLSSKLGYQVLIVPLQYISANEMKKILDPIKPRQAKVEIDDSRNIVIMAGMQAELVNMSETIHIFDVNQLKGMTVGMFKLKSSEPKTIISELDTIFGEEGNGPLAGMVKFVPIERLNSILVVTPQRKYLSEMEGWIDRLDNASEVGGGEGIHVYKVHNGQAGILSEMLTKLFTKENRKPSTKNDKATEKGNAKDVQAGAKNGAQGKTEDLDVGNVTIVADEENNLLVIKATATDFAKIEKALQRLDVLPRQVLVEVSIVEINLDNSLEYGLQWFIENGFKGSLRGESRFSSAVPSGGFSYSILDKSGAIRGLLATLASNSRANVISSPSLMVLDNRSATIRVGDQVPVRTSETTNTSSGSSALITSTIQYRDTGIILKVKPRVNASGVVIMDVSQEVSDVSDSTSGGVPSPTISTRDIETSIAVQSGETIVLGGLIKDRKDDTNSGIPVLRDIPVVGGLFSGTSNTKKRTELVVMITPSTVANKDEARQVTREYLRGMKQLRRTDAETVVRPY